MADHDGPSLDVRAHLLHEHCTRRLGDTHRATIVYDRDGLEGVHFRDDLRDAYSAARLEEFAETAWDVQSALLSIETDEDSLGGDRGDGPLLRERVRYPVPGGLPGRHPALL